MTRLRRFWPLITVPAVACVATDPAVEPVVPSGHHFQYSIANPNRIGLVQAFDDGSHTYLQFEGSPPTGAEIREPTEGSVLNITVEPHFVVVSGVYPSLRVSVDDQSTLVTNDAVLPFQGPTTPHLAALSNQQSISAQESAMRIGQSTLHAVAEPTFPFRAAPVGIPEALQTMSPTLRVAALKQEISTLEERVRFLAEELEEAHRTGRGSTLYIRDIAGPPRIALLFEDNSAVVQVDETMLGALGNTVRAANRVYLHGHTDAYVASDAGTQLAIRRAVEVRSLLISLHVEPQRMRMFYRGAGNFVANNSTAEGKARNRRVEIELRKW